MARTAGGERPATTVPFPFHTARGAAGHGAGERALDQPADAGERVRAGQSVVQSGLAVEVVREGIDRIWQTMRDCIERGIATEGILPGRIECAAARASTCGAAAREGGRRAARRSAGAAGLGDGVCHGGERRERSWRSRGDGADERSSGRGAGCRALLRALRTGSGS